MFQLIYLVAFSAIMFINSIVTTGILSNVNFAAACWFASLAALAGWQIARR